MDTVTERPDEKGYNGWTNYETWSVALIIDNDERTHSESRAIVRHALRFGKRSEYWAEADRDRYVVADALKEWIERESEDAVEMTDREPFSYLWAQLISAALGEVDWDEIARNYLSELDES
jgi:hypothetical protein